MSQFLAPIGRRLLVASLTATAALAIAAGVLHAESGPGCTRNEAFPGVSTPGPSAGPEIGVAMPASPATASPPPGACAEPLVSPETVTTIQIGAWDVYFDPQELHMPTTGASRMVLINRGFSTHNLTIDELGVELVVARGRTGEVTLEGVPPGTYTFYCSISGHRLAGMEGTLIVEG